MLFADRPAAKAALAGKAAARAVSTQAQAPVLISKRVQQPSADKSAGPICAGRGRQLTCWVAAFIDATRSIGRSIVVGTAAISADVVVTDIAGPVSLRVRAATSVLKVGCRLPGAIARRII